MNDIKFITLDNGLTILIYCDKTKITNHVELVNFLGGMSNEYVDYCGNIKKIKPGSAHVLEHYIYENTIYGDLMDKLYDIKAIKSNAVTYPEKTVMYFDTVYNFKECLNIFLNGMYNVIFSKEGLDKAKYAVYNEIRDSKDDLDRTKYWKKVGGVFSSSIDNLGTKTSVSSMSYRYLKDIYDNLYVPKNQFLVVAGNFDEEEVMNIINDFYSKCTFKNNKRVSIVKEDNIVAKKNHSMIGNDVTEVYISYKINTKDMDSIYKYKLDWYLGYFGDINFSEFSKFNEKLKKDNIIKGNISYILYNRCGYVVLEIGAYTKYKKEFIKRVQNVIVNFDNSNEELEFVKKESKLHLSVRSDYISNYVIPVIDNYISFNYPFNDTLEFVESLNYEEYIRIIKNINFDNYSIFVVKGEDINSY